MQLDSHTSNNGRYIIHSLYFDDYKDTSLYTTYAGISKRFSCLYIYTNTKEFKNINCEMEKASQEFSRLFSTNEYEK